MWKCRECRSDAIELQRLGKFESVYVCIDCGNNDHDIKNIAEWDD
ncbi:MAG: hypothetical protein ACRC4T_05660 [Cetobacterium sp.]